MNYANIDINGRWSINIDVSDAGIFREGEKPLDCTPEVIVRFFKDDIENIEEENGIEGSVESIKFIKDKIIDWSARAAGGLDISEFYCTGINIEIGQKGEFLGGETTFKRRYVL
ncbi:hypothetical protein OXPF_12000 [Oxobacter pfennigii]|uniref:Uncharacterized protein n=1 Tax=Oxobacter pfennigii TaxID=36849 RepID=A0A0P8X3F0_9CLOT|nr:hypothetical protein [Oxobacter pfennigii]KPU45307.1 hypothetical protein OXPF_12000 [Oxobacter pfennigii]